MEVVLRRRRGSDAQRLAHPTRQLKQGVGCDGARSTLDSTALFANTWAPKTPNVRSLQPLKMTSARRVIVRARQRPTLIAWLCVGAGRVAQLSPAAWEQRIIEQLAHHADGAGRVGEARYDGIGAAGGVVRHCRVAPRSTQPGFLLFGSPSAARGD